MMRRSPPLPVRATKPRRRMIGAATPNITHGDQQQRHGVGGGDLGADRLAEELQQLRGDDVEPRRDGDQRGGAEQGDRFQEGDDGAGRGSRAAPSAG